MTLSQYNETAGGITYLWVVSQAHPTGIDYRREDCCDVVEVATELGLFGLSGDVDEYGRWDWDGQGNPTDSRGNSILRIKAGFAGAGAESGATLLAESANWDRERKELVGNIMNAVEAVSSDWDREALRSYAEDVADSFQSGRIDEKGLFGIDENEKGVIRSAVAAVLPA